MSQKKDEGERLLHEAFAPCEPEYWFWDGKRLIPRSPAAFTMLREIEAIHRLRDWPDGPHHPSRQHPLKSFRWTLRQLAAWVGHSWLQMHFASSVQTPHKPGPLQKENSGATGIPSGSVRVSQMCPFGGGMPMITRDELNREFSQAVGDLEERFHELGKDMIVFLVEAIQQHADDHTMKQLLHDVRAHLALVERLGEDHLPPT